MSGRGRVAQVAVFKDGSGVVRWLRDHNAVGVSSFAIYESAQELLKVHGHGAKKTGSLEPVVEDDWIVEGSVAMCPRCLRVQEGTIGWMLSHAHDCGWQPPEQVILPVEKTGMRT